MLIPKGGGKDFIDIGLVEVLWKATTSIINLRMTAAIRYHITLHGFRTGYGKGTATLGAKLLKHMSVLHIIFLDLQNV